MRILPWGLLLSLDGRFFEADKYSPFPWRSTSFANTSTAWHLKSFRARDCLSSWGFTGLCQTTELHLALLTCPSGVLFPVLDFALSSGEEGEGSKPYHFGGKQIHVLLIIIVFNFDLCTILV